MTDDKNGVEGVDYGFDCWPNLEWGEAATLGWSDSRGMRRISDWEGVRESIRINALAPAWWVRHKPAPRPARMVRVGDVAPCVFRFEGREWFILRGGQPVGCNDGMCSTSCHEDTRVPESDILWRMEREDS